jgi:hypothetical protein
LTLGVDSITAVFSGDIDFLSSTSAPLVLTVKADAATNLTSSNKSPVVGQQVMFTATIQPLGSGLPTPTGSVTFYDGSTPIETVSLSGLVAELTWMFTTPGQHEITAVYSGDSDYYFSTSSVLTENVIPF